MRDGMLMLRGGSSLLIRRAHLVGIEMFALEAFRIAGVWTTKFMTFHRDTLNIHIFALSTIRVQREGCPWRRRGLPPRWPCPLEVALSVLQIFFWYEPILLMATFSSPTWVESAFWRFPQLNFHDDTGPQRQRPL